MVERIKKLISLFCGDNKEINFKYGSIKICFIYWILGFLWIYFSDRTLDFLFKDRNILLIVSTYKGLAYVALTTIIIYILINNLLKKISFTENELKNSYVELEAYVQQLAASEEELRVQYDQICENEQQLRKSEEKGRAIIQAIPDILFILDSKGTYLGCEASDESLLLIPKEKFLGKTIGDIMPKRVAELAYKNLDLVFKSGKLHSFEYDLNEIGIEEFYEIRMVKNGENEVLAILRGITERKKMENSLEYLSFKDQLTDLYNRRFYEKELERLDTEENLPLTIILGDVNGLKLINDSFGHAAGDELIKKAAEIIRESCSPEDVIARIGGDEFVILLPKKGENEAEKIIKHINKLASCEKVQNIEVSISFGYETKNCDEDIELIFTKAEDYMYKRKLFESSCMRGKTVKTIINTLNEKNKREEQHSVRVSELCEKMGDSLGFPERKIQELKTAGLLHDIGKVAIEENILNKSGKLTIDEYTEIKRHSEIGYRILSTVNELSEIAGYVLLHHEMWNGNGYPKGLKGEEIPIESRIIAIADAYDAMTSERSYRKALSSKFAKDELQRNAGAQFDSELVNVFIEKVIN